MDSHSWVLWVGVIAVVLHVIEEYSFGWLSWANEQVAPRFGIEIRETDFMLGSLGLVFIALAGAAIGWWAPAVSLAVPALFVLNAVFFHMLPSARDERLTPGTLSAVFIYLPVAAWMFWAAGTDDRLNFGTFVLAFVLGGAIMIYPVAMLVLRDRFGWEAQTARATSPGEESPDDAPPFEETPADLVDEQVDAQVMEPDEGGATAVLIADDEPETDPDETAIDLAQDAATESQPVDPAEDETTELRRD
ncbi:MAG TPA: HXXEE domain-containing protein [Solirubrobacterales bacterium]|nr:HXXEE domain-containing protein [Solirubrobacterales bacterium]